MPQCGYPYDGPKKNQRCKRRGIETVRAEYNEETQRYDAINACPEHAKHYEGVMRIFFIDWHRQKEPKAQAEADKADKTPVGT